MWMCLPYPSQRCDVGAEHVDQGLLALSKGEAGEGLEGPHAREHEDTEARVQRTQHQPDLHNQV